MQVIFYHAQFIQIKSPDWPETTVSKMPGILPSDHTLYRYCVKNPVVLLLSHHNNKGDIVCLKSLVSY